MKYLLAIYNDSDIRNGMSEEDLSALSNEYWKYTEELEKSGLGRGGEGLEPVSTATTVRVRDGKTQVTDGPFAETKETLAGFYMIECGTLDQAIDWASRIPGARSGSIEVRPVMTFDD
jgi:hypothetical protein